MNQFELEELAAQLAQQLTGGETIELIGDVGAGKTTFTKAFASALGVDQVVQSPTFTISNRYSARDGIELVHYDFYRLADPGIMSQELAETLVDPATITVLEWSDTVVGMLPEDRMTIHLIPTSETTRQVSVLPGGKKSQRICEALQ